MTAPRRARQLRTLIIVWSFIPAAIILGVVALAHFVSFRVLTEDLVSDHNRDLAVLLANQYMGEISELAQPLWALASNPEIISADPGRQQAALRGARDKLWSFDAGVIVLNAHGQVTAADERRLSLVGHDWASHPVFAAAQTGQTLILSDITPDGPANRDAVILAVPVLDERGRFIGVAAGMFAVGMAETRVTEFYGDIKKVMLDASGTTYVVDGGGRVVFHSDTRRIGEGWADQAAVALAHEGQAGTLRSQNEVGRETLASYAPVPRSGWGVIVEEDWDALSAASTPYQRFLLALLALGLIVPAGVLIVGTRRITRPVHELIGAAEAVANGDFNRRITPSGSDEIEALAEQFNRMAGELQESYRTLEQRVVDRTRELATLNAIAAVSSQSLDIVEVLRAALDKTLEVTGMTVGAAFRLDADDERLHLIVQRGLPAEFTALASDVARSDSVAGQVSDTLRPAVLRVAEYPEGPLKRVLSEAGVRLALSIPLAAKGRVLGFVNLGSQEVRAFTEDELALMASIGQQVGVAVENARLYEQAEETAAAAERSRLARELHDAVSQTLFSANMIAAVVPRLWERDENAAREQLAQLHQLTQGAQAEMRILLLELRPDALVETSLPDLLSQLGRATSSRAMLPVAVDIAGAYDPPLDVKIALYRIAQEALNNVVKHADPDHVTLSLVCDASGITLQVADDGCGFDVEAAPRQRLGQRSMRERAEAIGGQLSVTSTPGRGTTVTCFWQATPHPAPAGVLPSPPLAKCTGV